MDIYVNSANRNVYLDVPVQPVGGTITVQVKKDNVVVYEVDTVAFENPRYTFVLPFFLAQQDAALTVSWKFDYVENATTYTYESDTQVFVITPYVPIAEMTAALGDELSVTDILDVEKAVRNIVNAHCGQSFGKETGPKVAIGDGRNSLFLPARLINLKSFRTQGSSYALYDTANTLGDSFVGKDRYVVNGDGWYIKALGYSDAGVKADSSDSYTTNGIIFNPYRQNGPGFSKDDRFDIDGTWGWNYVPSAVVEATKLLLNDYASVDSAYRDRYLESLTSPDWRIQFHSGAFLRTGNVRADQLLSDYVLKRGWAII